METTRIYWAAINRQTSVGKELYLKLKYRITSIYIVIYTIIFK
jgi:hypothetical protein